MTWIETLEDKWLNLDQVESISITHELIGPTIYYKAFAKTANNREFFIYMSSDIGAVREFIRTQLKGVKVIAKQTSENHDEGRQRENGTPEETEATRWREDYKKRLPQGYRT